MSSEGKRAFALAAAAGLAAAIGVATLHAQRANASAESRDAAVPAVPAPEPQRASLLRLHVPRDWRDVVANDVFLDKTIGAVDGRLVIYVVGRNRHEAVQYMSQLYNLAWDVASLKGKFAMDVRIIAQVADKGIPTWDDVVRLPELTQVFGDDQLTAEQLNATREGLSPVTYHALSEAVKPYFRDDLFYFENKDTPLEGHSLVMVGGTFDHLHNGHKKLLSLAVGVSSGRMLVGITSDEMLAKKKNADLIETLEVRQQNVRDYVTFLKPSLQVDFAVLADAFGPSVVVEDSDAVLVVSTETVAAVPMIQDLRASRQLPPLKIFICRRTDGSTLSSSFIREQIAAARRR